MIGLKVVEKKFFVGFVELCGLNETLVKHSIDVFFAQFANFFALVSFYDLVVCLISVRTSIDELVNLDNLHFFNIFTFWAEVVIFAYSLCCMSLMALDTSVCNLADVTVLF